MIYKNIFLDFDDTIYDTRGNADIALEELYQHFSLSGYFKCYEDFYTEYWSANTELWSKYSHGEISKDLLIVERFLKPLRTVGINNEDFALQLSDWFLDCTSKKGKLVEGAIPLLDYLKGKYRLHILSNGFSEVQYKKLRNSGVFEYFDSIVLSEEAGANKPGALFFDYAMKITGANLDDCIMIGDNFDTDIVGARNYSIPQIYFNPKSLPVNSGMEPTFQVKDLSEIKNIL